VADFILRSRQPSPIFEHWTALDASLCAIGVTGVQILMRVLTLPGCKVTSSRTHEKKIVDALARCSHLPSLAATRASLSPSLSLSLSFSPSPSLSLARALHQVASLDLGRQDIGPRGARALVATLRINRTLTHVRLHGAFIHDSGGRCFADLLADRQGDPDEPATQLGELDLSVNMLSYQV